MSAGIQFYLYLSNVSVPLLGTGLVQTPEISGLRSIPNFIFFSAVFLQEAERDKQVTEGWFLALGSELTPPQHVISGWRSSLTTGDSRITAACNRKPTAAITRQACAP